MVKSNESNLQTCKTCRWVGCVHYGWERPSCIHFIPTDTTNLEIQSKGGNEK